MPTNVLIAGGGPAALEAALALHRLAGDRVDVTLLAPETQLTYRPLSVLAPFAAGGAPTYPLERIAQDAGFTQLRGRLDHVDPIAHVATTVTGERHAYDVLLIASGARPVEPFARATAFTGSLTDQERLHGIVQDVEAGYVRSIAFVVPPGATWPLPLYELALMLADRAYEMGAKPEIHFITPEPAPLALFGTEAAGRVAELLRAAGITLHPDSTAALEGPRTVHTRDATIEADRVISLPRLEGPALPGLPADARGFLVTDDHARVAGVPDVYAAGDVTAFAVKQGGIACQQADAAAAHIAFAAGAPVTPEPFTPVLRGLLVTEHGTLTLGDGGDAKIAGRELTAYLQGLDASVAAA